MDNIIIEQRDNALDQMVLLFDNESYINYISNPKIFMIMANYIKNNNLNVIQIYDKYWKINKKRAGRTILLFFIFYSRLFF